MVQINPEDFNQDNAFQSLTHVCEEIGPRLSGTPAEENVIKFIEKELKEINKGEIKIDKYDHQYYKGEKAELTDMSSNEVFNAFSPSDINTTTNGVFDENLDLNHNIAGNYEVRADINGTWLIDTPFGKYPYFSLAFIFQVPYISFTNSSNRMDFNITKALDVWFYIDGFSADNPTYPRVSRLYDLNLTAQVISVGTGPVPGKLVNFYDYSRGDVLIGSDITDTNGIASILYTADDYCRAGPNLLYARIRNNFKKITVFSN